MAISNAQAFAGLTAVATPSKTGITGSLTLSGGTSRMSLPEADAGYAFVAYIAAGAYFSLNVLESDFASTSAWTAGVAQVETATAAGTISTAGNASVVVTAAGMSGTPKTIAVAVALSDTADLWAEKVRVALAADSAVAALFTVGGTGTAITLTRKPANTIDDVNFYVANDATLNIALYNGTCAGITTAATSANTTAGVLTQGVLLLDGDGNDFQGVAISMSELQAICFEGGGVALTMENATVQEFVIMDGQTTVHAVQSGSLSDYESVAATGSGSHKVTITVLGKI